MVRENDFIAVFHSIHRVMKAEKILKGAGVPILLIPAPREISSDCGLALRYTPDDAERIQNLLFGQGLPPAEVYQYQGGKFTAQEIFP
ncbi:MAG: hypothetical protein CVU69_12390 [Deltaproteobacteria bacterium HGW-Deltaproteobacteria-4]|nr:MAG: hypothetical protein CVU69_12390 [Deltaproteobacteria bacterium HGW-Deltaproteobacteria-4]